MPKTGIICPSSAQIERLFSAGGQLLSKLRGCSAGYNFEKILLLKLNKRFLQFNNYIIFIS